LTEESRYALMSSAARRRLLGLFGVGLLPISDDVVKITRRVRSNEVDADPLPDVRPSGCMTAISSLLLDRYSRTRLPTIPRKRRKLGGGNLLLSNRPPQPRQNFAPSGFSTSHCGHCTVGLQDSKSVLTVAPCAGGRQLARGSSGKPLRRQASTIAPAPVTAGNRQNRKARRDVALDHRDT
jgi:hypothetical protein